MPSWHQSEACSLLLFLLLLFLLLLLLLLLLRLGNHPLPLQKATTRFFFVQAPEAPQERERERERGRERENNNALITTIQHPLFGQPCLQRLSGKTIFFLIRSFWEKKVWEKKKNTDVSSASISPKMLSCVGGRKREGGKEGKKWLVPMVPFLGGVGSGKRHWAPTILFFFGLSSSLFFVRGSLHTLSHF